MLILVVGKNLEKLTFLGYMFVGILTAFEVLAVLYFLFTMNVPNL